MGEGQLIVGFIRGPHGITGEMKVESASGDYEHIAALEEVTLRRGSSAKKCSVVSAEPGCGILYMKLAEINSPEEVRKYVGWGLEVPREYAHPLADNEWYIEDLKGCSLLWSGGGTAVGTAPTETVGTITDVLEGGAGYLLEVSLSESCTALADDVKHTAAGKPRSVLVPFTFQHVQDVDVKNKTMQLMHLWILE
ncbi:MAG: ribosome maturation factor RimM [Treponemataceae bacterium]|nr:ribosome maturation factor RimM [Treponemataceae bacterium]